MLENNTDTLPPDDTANTPPLPPQPDDDGIERGWLEYTLFAILLIFTLLCFWGYLRGIIERVDEQNASTKAIHTLQADA